MCLWSSRRARKAIGPSCYHCYLIAIIIHIMEYIRQLAVEHQCVRLICYPTTWRKKTILQQWDLSWINQLIETWRECMKWTMEWCMKFTGQYSHYNFQWGYLSVIRLISGLACRTWLKLLRKLIRLPLVILCVCVWYN